MADVTVIAGGNGASSQLGIVSKLPKDFILIEPHAKTSWFKQKQYPLKKWQKIVLVLLINMILEICGIRIRCNNDL